MKIVLGKSPAPLAASSLLFAAFGLAASLQAAGIDPDSQGQETVYEVHRLDSIGGVMRGSGINSRGWVAGFSDLDGGAVRKAMLWVDGDVFDLTSHNELNSSVAWPGLSERGLVAGITEIPEPDPHGPGWSCSFFFPSDGSLICRGFAWEHGKKKLMPTLGGFNSYATSVNNRGQVVGWAETDIEDPSCSPPLQVLQFRAAVWEPHQDRIRELPPYPGDETSAAVGINDRGQVVGISGECDIGFGGLSARRAILWDGDDVIDLGNLGGSAWNTAVDINQKGTVVGFSNLADDGDGAFNAQAFYWTRQEGIQPLGTLDGDFLSQANAINERDEAVGGSCCSAPNNWRAVIWQNGEIVDLNERIRGEFEGHLYFARDIDNRGVITGDALDPHTGEFFGFVASPKRRAAP